MAPSKSSVVIAGHLSRAPSGDSSSQSMSYAAALAAVRLSWTIRSSVRATITPPTGRYPVARPVSPSSEA